MFVFDLDGVIRHWDPGIVARAERAHGLPAGVLLGAAFEPGLLLSVVTGKVTDGAWRTEVTARLAQAYPHADATGAVADWSRPAGDVIAGTEDILDRTRTIGKVCLLTNATDRLPRDLDALGLTARFDAIFNSSEIGFAKPDQRVFEHVERQLNVHPHDIVYVDDGPVNIEAAARRGWVSLLASPTMTLPQLLSPLLNAKISG